MYLTKKELVKWLNKVPSDLFNLSFEVIKPPVCHDDGRDRRVFRPYVSPGELRIEIVTKYDPEK